MAITSDVTEVRDGSPRDGVKAHAQELPPGHQRTEVGVIPEDWCIKQLTDVCVPGGIVRGPFGGALKKETFVNSGFKVYEQRNAIYKSCEIGQYFVDQVKYNEMQRFRISPGDFIVSCSGTIGRIYQVPQNASPGIINQALLKLTTNAHVVDDRYFYVVFESDDFQARIIDSTQGGAMKNLVGMDVFRTTPVVAPPIHEQRAIAEALSDVDGLLGALKALIAKKRAIKQAAMQQLLTGKTRLPGFGGEWETKRLGDVVERFIGGGTPSRSNPTYWGNEIPWMTVKDFATFSPRSTQERITQSGLANSAAHLIPAGTLITATRMALGRAVVYEVDVAINQDLKALILKAPVDVLFLRYWFELFGGLIDDIGGGSTVKGVSIGELSQLAFHGPSKPEQTAIATVLSDMDAEIAALEARRDKTRAIKQGMMQQLLTGRVRLVKPKAAA